MFLDILIFILSCLGTPIINLNSLVSKEWNPLLVKLQLNTALYQI
jgi:hypothetical protein